MAGPSGRSKARVCGRSLAGIARSKPAGSMDVSLLCCVLSDIGLCFELITLPRGVLPNAHVSECDHEPSQMRRPWSTGGCCAMRGNVYIYIYISYRSCLSWVKSAPFCIVWLPRNKICSWISALTADTQYFEIHFSVTWSVIVLYALIMISGLSYISTVGIGSFPEGKPAGAWRWPPTSI